MSLIRFVHGIHRMVEKGLKGVPNPPRRSSEGGSRKGGVRALTLKCLRGIGKKK